MKKRKKQVATPVKKVEEFKNKSPFLFNTFGINLEEDEFKPNEDDAGEKYFDPSLVDKLRKNFFSNQL